MKAFKQNKDKRGMRGNDRKKEDEQKHDKYEGQDGEGRNATEHG